jgi:hypothetical protein
VGAGAGIPDRDMIFVISIRRERASSPWGREGQSYTTKFASD